MKYYLTDVEFNIKCPDWEFSLCHIVIIIFCNQLDIWTRMFAQYAEYTNANNMRMLYIQ